MQRNDIETAKGCREAPEIRNRAAFRDAGGREVEKLRENRRAKKTAGDAGHRSRSKAPDSRSKGQAGGARAQDRRARRQDSRSISAHEKESWKPGNLLYPLPAVMVSCQRPGERPNIITVAWAGTTCSSPAMVSISIRPERYSYGIIRETGEFVINLVNRELTYATDFCGVRSGRDVDKFKEMNLTPVSSETVSAPSIKESPVNIQCRVTQVIPLGSHDLFLAEVTGITVDQDYMDEKGKFHLNSTGLVAYSHGEYFLLGEKLGKFGYSVQKRDGQKR